MVIFNFATWLHLFPAATHSDLRTFINILSFALAIHLAVQPALFHALHVHADHTCQRAKKDNNAPNGGTISQEEQACSLCELYQHITLAWQESSPGVDEAGILEIADQPTFDNYKTISYRALRGPPCFA